MQTTSQTVLTAPRARAQRTEPMVPYAWRRYAVVAGVCAPQHCTFALVLAPLAQLAHTDGRAKGIRVCVTRRRAALKTV